MEHEPHDRDGWVSDGQFLIIQHMPPSTVTTRQSASPRNQENGRGVLCVMTQPSTDAGAEVHGDLHHGALLT
jgi:hypothetical protein